jgi:L-lactate utilization protein LutC
MTSARDVFLERVRRAVQSGNRAGQTPVLQQRGNVGYQVAGADPTRRFRDEFAASGGQTHLVPDQQTAIAKIMELVQAKSARRVLVGSSAVLDSLGLPARLRGLGIEVMETHARPPDSAREAFFAADLGITGVDYLIAETGSIALLTRADEPRSLSLLPPVHIAVARTSQVLPDLFDLFGPSIWGDTPVLPSCLTLITGPSKTGDIELRLVTGVHGPGEVHVVLIDPTNPAAPDA